MSENSEQNSSDRVDKEKQQPEKRSALRALIQDFNPIWFQWCMNAGIISILLHQLPYQFPGLLILSTIAFVVELVLFVVFSVIFLARFVWFRAQAFSEVTSNIQDLSLLACWPIAWLVLSSLVCMIVSQARWGLHAFTIVGYVMWWFGAAWMLLTYLSVFVIMIRTRSAAEDAGGRLPPLILIPIMGIATVATTGGLITNYSYQMSARMAVPVIIYSFLMIGIAIFTATMLYTLLTFQLFSSGWPAPEITPAMFVLIGPLGQCAGALQLLGTSASSKGRFMDYGRGTFLTGASASPLNVACVLLALLCAGMSIIWAFLVVYAMLERAFQKQLSWTPTWNSIIFPIGTLTTAMNSFAIEMNSPTFRTVNTALVVILVILFFLNLAFTLFKIAKGQLLIVKEDPRQKED